MRISIALFVLLCMLAAIGFLCLAVFVFLLCHILSEERRLYREARRQREARKLSLVRQQVNEVLALCNFGDEERTV